jgi:hypothetical protein
MGMALTTRMLTPETWDVEAYPEQTEERPPQRGAYLHTGPEELYARYGFTRVRKIAKWRWVMRASV